MNDRIYLSPPSISGNEKELVAEAIDSNWIAPLGPEVEAFEAEFASEVGVARALVTSTGTAALHLALDVLGVGDGDVVLAPSFTFIGGVSPIRYVGAEPWSLIRPDRHGTSILPCLSRRCERLGVRVARLVPSSLLTCSASARTTGKS